MQQIAPSEAERSTSRQKNGRHPMNDGWVWMRTYMESKLMFWDAIFKGGLCGFCIGNGEVEDSGA
jgi:hypothetical protein